MLVALSVLPACDADGAASSPQRPEPVTAPTPTAQAASEPDCDTTPGRLVDDSIATAYGEGPVYAVLRTQGGEEGLVRYGDSLNDGGNYYYKVLFAAAPKYRGKPVTVTGRDRGDGSIIMFEVTGEVPGRLEPQLLLPGNPNAEGWTYWPTNMVIDEESCYELQIDGEGISDLIVFAAVEAVR